MTIEPKGAGVAHEGRLLVPSWLIFVWVGVAGLASARTWLAGQDERTPLTLLHSLALEGPGWLLWILVTPLVLRTIDRFGPPGRYRLWMIAAHAALLSGTVLASAALAFGALLLIAPNRPAGADLSAVFGELVMLRSLTVGAVYGLVVAMILAIRSQREVGSRRVRESVLEAQLARAELSALRARVHPHFLFNALQALSSLIDTDPAAAKSLVGRLAYLLRVAVDGREREMVPLSDELDLARAYLDVERTRFGDRLSVSFDVPPDALECQVPTLVLQPIVENAVVHGIGPRAGPGAIRISADREAGALHLAVEDDGVGLPPRVREGVGLSVTRERLRRRYGPDQRLVLEAGDQGGTRVLLRLPTGSVQ